MSLRRRDFIIGTVGAAATTSLLDACGDDDGANPKPDGGLDGPDAGGTTPVSLPVNTTVFAHGIASGDPLTNRVIIWTRVSGATEAVMLEYAISTDPEFRQNVFGTQVGASPDNDFTVKVDVQGLEAGKTYYYMFLVPTQFRSVVGRTRTLPMQIDRARIVFTSCANYQNGYFNAYGAIAKRNDLDVWVHLGDYIYEYPAGTYGDPTLATQRAHLPANECLTLADYRTRYAQYRTDTDLQEIHRLHPLVVVWDDHEVADNAWVDGARNHTADGSEGSWADRKRAGTRAFLEWLPIRVEDAPTTPKIFRSFAFGDLFDLIMLDTRMIARSKQAGGDAPTTPGVDALPGTDVGTREDWTDPNRQLLGTEQEGWFLDTLSKSRANWRLIGNQVIFAQTRSPLNPANILFSDFWDGYQEPRRRVIQHIAQNGIHNVVFLTGDIHSSWAMEISEDPFAASPKPPFAIELVGPSITSRGFEGQQNPNAEELVGLLLSPGLNPHVKFGEATRKGYVLVDLTAARLQAEWYVVEQFKAPGIYAETLLRSYTCDNRAARLVETTTPSTPKPPQGVPA
jgi:alkaline phosphatase D